MKAWAESLGGIHYPLLSDFWPHGAVAERFGVLRPGDGHSERAIFVIDKKGCIRYIDIHDIDDRPDNEEVRKALRQIEAADREAQKAAAPSASYAVSGIQDDEIPIADIVLYCARWCKDCRKAKAWLDERGLAYAEVDIDYNMAARNQVRRWSNGFLVTPIFDIGGTVILDLDLPKLEQTLREKGLLTG